MKRNMPPPRPDSPRPAVGHIHLLAFCLTALLIGFLAYPVRAFPLEGLALTCLLALVAALTTGRCLSDPDIRRRWLAAAGRLPVLAGLALVLWALARWWPMPVRSAGTEWVIGLLAFAMALVLGVSCVTWANATGQGGSDRMLVLLRRGLVLAALAFALLAFYQYFYAWDRLREAILAGGADPTHPQTEGLLHALGEKRVAGRLGNPNLFAAQLTVLAIFCIATALARSSRLAWRLTGAVAWLALLGALVLTGSRGGVLAFAVFSLIAFTAGAGGLGALGARAAASMACLLLALPAAAAGLAERLGNIATIRERLFYWEIAGRIWAAEPVLGGGPGSFALRYASLKSPLARESQYAHSWLMQAGAELGLIGLALLLLFWLGMAVLAWRIWRGRSSSAPAEPFWALLALLALGFNGLYEFTLQWQAFLVLTGLLAGIGCAGAVPLGSPSTARGWVATALGAAALAGWLWLGPAWHLANHHRLEGRDHLMAGDPAAAAESFAAAIRHQPDDAGHRLDRAHALARLGQIQPALELAREAAALNPHAASAHAMQARLLIAQGRAAKALAAYDEALARYPTHLGHRMDKARLLIEQGRGDEARPLLESIDADRLPTYPHERLALDELRRRAGLPPSPAA